MIKLTKVSKVFVQDDLKLKALDEINLTIEDNTFTAILGKSGSGKSTLLALLGALDRPTAGSIMFDNREITKMSDRQLTQYRRNELGFIFQSYNLIANLTALENVMIPMEFAGVKKGEQLSRARKLLEDVGIVDDKQNRVPAKLSGGEQQRVAIARALANNPKLILADEPTGNLDSKTGKIIVSMLKALARSKTTTVVVVTHDEAMSEEADHVIRLKDGKLMSS
ncbi:MAG: ABC transporter ATP-binding protein [Candidatus Berkelbacteria bacterium]